MKCGFIDYLLASPCGYVNPVERFVGELFSPMLQAKFDTVTLFLHGIDSGIWPMNHGIGCFVAGGFRKGFFHNLFPQFVDRYVAFFNVA
tara:strand:- start:224 stop:490 length:267 start_codon:yes stop_codon:yes gene_type:complete